jgi:hypothetical protein
VRTVTFDFNACRLEPTRGGIFSRDPERQVATAKPGQRRKTLSACRFRATLFVLWAAKRLGPAESVRHAGLDVANPED